MRTSQQLQSVEVPSTEQVVIINLQFPTITLSKISFTEQVVIVNLQFFIASFNYK